MTVRRLRVYCVGNDNNNCATHAPFVVANLVIDPAIGPYVLLGPTAQQRGNPQAGPPRKVAAAGEPLTCRPCRALVRVSDRRLKRLIHRAHDAGVSSVPLSDLR